MIQVLLCNKITNKEVKEVTGLEPVLVDLEWFIKVDFDNDTFGFFSLFGQPIVFSDLYLCQDFIDNLQEGIESYIDF
jgi:hypothetical protein